MPDSKSTFPSQPAQVPGSRTWNINPQTKSWHLGRVREVEWKNSKDGLTRRGILITPPGYQPGRLYPTVVNTHPGDTAWWVGFHAKWWAWGQLLASNGYVVFLPNTRGVTGEGGQLHSTIADWGGMAFQDLMDGVDHLVAQKIADPDRLVLACSDMRERNVKDFPLSNADYLDLRNSAKNNFEDFAAVVNTFRAT
jgi:dipeptidyl aminopeptidase/acylaminoacyl peptidase